MGTAEQGLPLLFDRGKRCAHISSQVSPGKRTRCRECHGKVRCHVVLDGAVSRHRHIEDMPATLVVVGKEVEVVTLGIEVFEEGRGVDTLRPYR